MNKLDNETWDEYAFKNNLFKIKYTDNDKQIIHDICIPNPNIINHRTCDWGYYMSCVYGGYNGHNAGFLEFIMHELYTLRDKYKLAAYCVHIEFVENNTEERKEDINRQKWLFKELEFWERKWRESFNCKVIKDKEQIIQRENDKNRYLELKAIISKTHEEQLDELIELSKHVEPIIRIEKIQIEKKERIKLYQDFMKNKKIHLEISILEEKINQLKEEIVL
jgi:hypothetical protein